MLSQTLTSLTALAALVNTAASICYDPSETTSLMCYTAPDNTPQDVAVADVVYIAAYLRAYGAQTRAGRLFTMAAADTPDCEEWSLYAHGSALATAKHTGNTLNSSVLFSDIANTIDGGAAATATQQAASLLGCDTEGGSLGVVYNASNTAYTASTYPVGYTPAGILIKIVSSGA